MKLSKKALNAFKKLYLQKYGVALSDEKANELGARVLRFYSFKYKDDRHR